jgi:glutamate 5-kinase
MKNNRKPGFDRVKRMVVKIGSNVLTENNGLNLTAIRSITRQICRLIDAGLEVILVSSGAMASGVKKVGLANYSAADIRKIMGLKSKQIKAVLGHKVYDEVIHRDNLAITYECEV